MTKRGANGVARTKRNQIRLTEAAQRDLSEIAVWSVDKFGQAAALRYSRLIAQALNDIAANPNRPGAQIRPELDRAHTYHLRFSRKHARAASRIVVHDPRHFVIYRVREGAVVDILRILHDSRDLVMHTKSTG